MRHDRLWILGGFLAGAMIAVGCGSSSSSTDGGAAGHTGSGGSGAGGKGAGGSMDAGADKGPATDAGGDTSGAGGSGSTDAQADKGTDAGSGDTAMDMAVDTPTDTPRDTGPCVTDYGAGNPVQFAFDGGANQGWTVFGTHNSQFPLSNAASFTEGHSCPGALILGLNFTAYGQSAATEFFYGLPPNGKNWTGYKALHAWLKAETDTLSELTGVYFYMKSGSQAFYQNNFVAGANLSDWHEVVIDLTRAPNNGNGVVINDVSQIGFEAALNAGPAAGAPATPSQVLLLVDDIWLEAAPPSDAGAVDGGGQ